MARFEKGKRYIYSRELDDSDTVPAYLDGSEVEPKRVGTPEEYGVINVNYPVHPSWCKEVEY